MLVKRHEKISTDFGNFQNINDFVTIIEKIIRFFMFMIVSLKKTDSAFGLIIMQGISFPKFFKF